MCASSNLIWNHSCVCGQLPIVQAAVLIKTNSFTRFGGSGLVCSQLVWNGDDSSVFPRTFLFLSVVEPRQVFQLNQRCSHGHRIEARKSKPPCTHAKTLTRVFSRCIYTIWKYCFRQSNLNNSHKSECSGLGHNGEKPQTQESHAFSIGRLFFQHHNSPVSWTAPFCLHSTPTNCSHDHIWDLLITTKATYPIISIPCIPVLMCWYPNSKIFSSSFF